MTTGPGNPGFRSRRAPGTVREVLDTPTGPDGRPVEEAAAPSRMGELRSLVAAGLHGRPVFSTTSRGVEFALMAGTVGARLMLLLQISASVSTGLDVSPRPSVYGLYLALGAGWSLVFIALVVRRRRPAVRWTVRADIAVAAACLIVQPCVVPAGHLFDTWTSWGYAFALNVLCSSSCSMLGRCELGIAAFGVSGVYLVTRLSDSPVADAAVWSNVVSMLLFPALIHMFAGYLRRLGADADAARAAAGAAAERAERERHQLLLHDSATILRLLAVGELPPELAAVVRRQAASESNRIRRFLEARTAAVAAGAEQRIGLTDVVQESADAFADLPIDVVTDLADGVLLSPERADAVRLALSGLLSNIRMHASASHIVLHGDWDHTESEWELVLRDDGIGFDPDETGAGFGLEVQVRRSLAVHGITCVVQSAPGQGTVAVLRGPDDLTGLTRPGASPP